MDKFKVFLLVSLVCAGFVWSALKGRSYYDEKNLFEIDAPSGWKVNLKTSKKDFLTLAPDGVSEVGIDVLPLEADQHSAQDVAVGHIIAYDGWEYIAGRRLGWTEKRGSTSAFSAMYSKSLLGSTGSSKKVIAQEYYFVKYGKAYVVTLMTDDDHWFEIKNDLVGAIDSFRIK